MHSKNVNKITKSQQPKFWKEEKTHGAMSTFTKIYLHCHW